MNYRKIFVSVYDSAVGAYASPILVPSRGVAVRSFTDEVNRKAEGNTLYNHPSDFELRLLAEFDESAGVFYSPPDGIETICRGKDVHNSEG